ncbi:MAG: hypothetical protein ABR521_02590 [Gaiellaceae bacterium]
MPEGLGPRMAVETGFLILLAVGAGLADLEPLLIVLVMGIGWILVVLWELMAWRAGPRWGAEPASRSAAIELPAAAPAAQLPPQAEYARAGVVEAPPEYPPAPAAPESDAIEATAVSPAAPPVRAEPSAPPVQPEPGAAAEPAPTGFRAPQRQRVSHRLPPLQPRPKKRWFRRAETRETAPPDHREQPERGPETERPTTEAAVPATGERTMRPPATPAPEPAPESAEQTGQAPVPPASDRTPPPAAESAPEPVEEGRTAEYDFEFAKPQEPEVEQVPADAAAAGAEGDAPEGSAAEPALGFAAPQRQRVSHRLPPLQPRPKKRWFARGGREESRGKEERH